MDILGIKLKRDLPLKFKMHNLPDKPTFTYYVYDAACLGYVSFSSIESTKLQYQAEHFTMTKQELFERLKDGSIKTA